MSLNEVMLCVMCTPDHAEVEGTLFDVERHTLNP